MGEESKQVGLAKTILLLRQCLHTCRGRSGNYIPDFTWKRVARDACAPGLVPDDCEWQNIRDRYLQASEDVRHAARRLADNKKYAQFMSQRLAVVLKPGKRQRTMTSHY